MPSTGSSPPPTSAAGASSPESLALQHGRGGIALAARITGLSPHTIRRGRHELAQAASLPGGRVRRPGGGRKPVEKKVPRS